MLRKIEPWIYLTATHMAKNKIIQKLRTRAEETDFPNARFQERLGIASDVKPDGKLVWFHALDLNAALPIFDVIEQINEQDLGVNFLVTTRRHKNIETINDHIPSNTIHQFLPIDLDEPIQTFLNIWKPDVAIISQGEFWPRVLFALQKMKVPTIALNTVMNDKGYYFWRWLPGLAKSVLSTFDLILAQDQKVAKKLKHLGAPASAIRITGLLSGSKRLLDNDDAYYSGMSSSIGSRSVWMAAVTNRDEEDVVINAHKIAMRRNRRLLLILHTREMNRGISIAERYKNQNLKFALSDKNETPDDMTDIFISDKMNELATFLRLASVTFCGGTLSDGGTLDPFHPASTGSAIIHGPSYGDYELDFSRYNTAGAARLVTNGGQLAQAVNEIVAPDVAAGMAHAGWEICSEGGEVSGVVITEILDRIAEGTQSDATT